MSRQSRRRFLAVAAASLGLLAGCSQSSPDAGASSGGGTSPATSSPAETEPTPELMDGTPAPADLVDAKTNQFVDRLADESFDWAAGMFGGVLAGVDASRLAATWRGLTIQHGPYETHEITARQVQEDRSLRAIALQFETAVQRVSLIFDPYARIVGLDFPTRASRLSTPDSRSTDVTLSRAGDGGCSLGATVTLPSGDDPVPGVVVVHRAGPHDRDGTVGPNRPYRDLAEQLAATGVASLRYEKRSHACDLSKGEQSLRNVVVADAVTAVDHLAGVDRVSDVVLLGHGLGGVAAPLVAREANVAGLILAATPTRPLSEVFFESERQKAEADGTVTLEEQQRLDFFREKLNQTETLEPDEDYYILGTSTTFWRDLRDHDVVAAVRDRPEPVLALHPRRGFVTTEADLRTWRDQLSGDAVRSYPELDHLFMRVFGDSLPEAYFFPDTVDPVVADDVAAWIQRVVG